MKFQSLIYREFRVSRKSILLQAALLLVWLAGAWGLLVSIGANDLGADEQYMVSHTIMIVTALIAAMSLLVDESFKSDVRSGWLSYSYTLPITPFERAAAKFALRLSVILSFTLISLGNAAAICVYIHEPFNANYIVWHLVILTAVFGLSLPNDLFLLRARNNAELKKMQNVSGMAMAGLMIAAVVIILKANGIGLQDLAADDLSIQFPVFTAAAFLWAVPLLLAVMAVSFFAVYHNLRFAYQGAEKPESKTEPPQAVSITQSGVSGLFYKELRQNRLVLILAALAPIILTAFPFCFTAIGAAAGSVGVDEIFETAADPLVRMLMFVTGFFIVCALMSEAFHGDDKKLWAYFIVSTPQGTKGYLYRKYGIVLMINLIYMVSGIFADELLATVNYFVTGKELTVSISSFYLIGVFLSMFVIALDIPFTVRYGLKKGSMVKMTALLSICAAAVVTFTLLPDKKKLAAVELITSLFNGNVYDLLMLILSLFPYLAFAAFLFSYKISCGMFMKGVNDYDK